MHDAPNHLVRTLRGDLRHHVLVGDHLAEFALEGKIAHIAGSVIREQQRIAALVAGVRNLPGRDLDVSRGVIQLLRIEAVGHVELRLPVVGEKDHAREPDTERENSVAGIVGLKCQHDRVRAARVAKLGKAEFGPRVECPR